MDSRFYDHIVPRRSDGTRQDRRPAQPWPEERPFRILSIDGGGILGVLPATILSELERRYLDNAPIGSYFDMIVGTSTGGIIALGLAQGLSASEILKFYFERGEFIFPRGNLFSRFFISLRQWALYRYDEKALENELRRIFGDALFGSSKIRLCIPSFEGRYGEPWIFKTPHHPDYKKDQYEKLVDVGMATAAAPTYFRSLEKDGYTMLDGGIWANNPIMIGIVDALTCFKIDRSHVHVLSLGCGQDKFRASHRLKTGGRLNWAYGFHKAAMRAQSLNALGQAFLLLGKDNVLRLDAPETSRPIAMDDVVLACNELPQVGRTLVESSGRLVFDHFLQPLKPTSMPLAGR